MTDLAMIRSYTRAIRKYGGTIADVDVEPEERGMRLAKVQDMWRKLAHP